MKYDKFTRRDALSLVGASLLALAGCSGETSEPGDGQSQTPTAAEPDYSHVVDDPDAVRVRNSNGEPAVRSSVESPGEDIFESSATWDYEDWLLTTSSERAALTFSDGTTGVEEATGFINGTDLSEETVLVHQYNISECETRRIDQLKWGDGFSCGSAQCVGIRLNYALSEQKNDCPSTDSGSGPPYDEGTRANETTFVRIPALISSYGRFGVQS